MNDLRQLLLLLFGLLMLTGCSNQRVTPAQYQHAHQLAESYRDAGQPAKAAKVYRHLAETAPNLQNQFTLMAIESMISAGDSQTAKNYADSISPDSLTLEQKSLLNLYYAQIDLSFGQAEQAVNRLQLIVPRLLSPAALIKFHRARAFAYSLTGALLKSAEARVELGRLLAPAQQQANNAAILETLSLMSLPEIEQTLPQTTGTLSGWLGLARALKLKEQNHALSNTAIRDWQLNHPDHPANSEFLKDYLGGSSNAFKRPQAIAVLLPESGLYARAGNAVRKGVMAAYYQDRSADKPEIRFYDSRNASLPALYHQALAEGAEMIIGPLSKSEIETLSDSVEFGIPVLALNHVPGITKPNLYQFGLSPIDDAEQLTSQAWFDGHQNAVMLTPANEQGKRIGTYLKEYWERADGTLLETQSYDPRQTDFSNIIKQLLNLDESERRYHQLRRIIPSIHYVPRRRQDVDIIFLNAYETVARSINPQLKFFHASHVPVYATPHVYSGLPNPALDLDLNNITFCDIPWLFESSYPGELSLQALHDTWKPFPAIYLRLLALGIDAYNVIAHLDKLHTIQYHGATGNLVLTDTNRIKRNLVCAKFAQGTPAVIGFVKSPADRYESIAVSPDGPPEQPPSKTESAIVE